MARIRTVKPEFWTAEQVMELSPMARLLFIGLWNFCDDRGVHPVAYKTLKAEVFPADDLLSSDVERLVGELIAQGLLSEFEAEGRRWWFVTGWHHQVINRPSKSRYPEPPRNAPLPSAAGQGDDGAAERDDSLSATTGQDESSMRTQCALTEGSLTEGKGREGKGREGKGEERSPLPATDPSDVSRKGAICRLLRQEARVADAAPHQLDDTTWGLILAKRTDEEIVEFAKAKVEARQGQRTGLRYLAPGLIDDPKPILPNARASPTLADRNRQAADEAKRLIFGEG